MHCNTIVKARRLAQGVAGEAAPDRTPPRHDSPQGSRTARDSRHLHHTNHPLRPHSRPVAAQARRGARTHSPWPLPSHSHKSIAEHAADRANKNCPPSSSPAPVVVSFPPPFPRRPASCITPLSRPSPIPHPPDSSCLRSRSRASPARPISPRSSSSLVCFSLRGDSLRLVSGDLGARRRPSAAGQVCFHGHLRCLGGGAHLHRLLCRLPALVGAGPGGGAEIHPGLGLLSSSCWYVIRTCL